MRDELTSRFTSNETITFGEIGEWDGVRIDYYHPMQAYTEAEFVYDPADYLSEGYTKLVEYTISVPISNPVDGNVTGNITVPLPSGYDGASAKTLDGISASGSTSTTVTFPVTLSGGFGTFTAEYKEATTPPAGDETGTVPTGGQNSNTSSSQSTIDLTATFKGVGGEEGICKQTVQGPKFETVILAKMPAGCKVAFSFNLLIKENGSFVTNYTLRNGKLVLNIPKEWQKAGRSFAIIGVDKDGVAKIFTDEDSNDATFTTTLNIEGYAFALIYSDDGMFAASGIYIVTSGDTLSQIARKLDKTVPYLVDKNHLTNPNRLKVGQKIVY